MILLQDVEQLLPKQRELIASLSKRLGAIRGVKAVVLGGSHARRRAQPQSDLDLYILYSETAPFSVQSIRELTIGGQRVDFVYRSVEHQERVIADAEAGRYELHFAQQPPFGFFSAAYLGEIDVCIALFDPEAQLEALKRRVANYPEALRRAVVQDFLWAAEFELIAFAPKFAARSGAYGTSACLARAVNYLLLVLFALNRRYFMDDKTALAEVAEFELAPREFGPRVQETLAHVGTSSEELAAAVARVVQLYRETVELTGEIYHPRFTLPK